MAEEEEEGGGGDGRAAVLASPAYLAFDQAGRNLLLFIDLQMVTFGDPAWIDYLPTPELGTLSQVLLPALNPTGESGRLISEAERAAALASDMGVLEPGLVNNLIDRLNRTTTYNAQGFLRSKTLNPA